MPDDKKPSSGKTVSLAYVEAALRTGLLYMRSGKYQKSSKPSAVLGAATNCYVLASNGFDKVPKPGDEAPEAEKQRYDNMQVKLGTFRTELVDYAKEAADKVAKNTNAYVSNVERMVKQADKGRKFWGVPYAPRPSRAKIEKAVEKAKSQLASVLIRDVKSGAKGEAKGGKEYLLRSQGDLKAIQTSLERAGSLTDAEGQYLAEKKDLINQNLSKLEGLWNGYIKTIDDKERDALARAEKAKLDRAKRASQAELDKLAREREEDLEIHLRELGKRKW